VGMENEAEIPYGHKVSGIAVSGKQVPTAHRLRLTAHYRKLKELTGL
jgi:hypothetical protein